ncbi:MAG: GHKL domain-containing protein [Bacteroidaceae bacterium]|nr:GHKL domain-containing protein [Bacteroidaceae bacterium]
MKKIKLPLSKPLFTVVLLAIVAVAVGWLAALGHYHLCALCAILVLLLAAKLVNVYSGIVKKLDFIFTAVRNSDFSYRFVENPKRAGYSVINHSLNRIKEVLDETKLKAAEKEKFFETIMECANVGIMVVFENGTVMKHNSKAIALLGVPMLSHIERLRPLSVQLADAMCSILPMEKRSVCFATETGNVNLLLTCSAMVYDGRNLRVISIEDINKELDTQEGLAWEKLTRILTHEIMNSLAPVTSISNTLLHAKENPDVLHQGLETIHATSDRLMQFVDSFREVTRIPPPKKNPFYLADLLNDTKALVNCNNVSLSIDIFPVDTMIYADRVQLQQVFVNLLKNAADACALREGVHWIEVRSHIAPDEKVCIEVSNSGGAIPADVAENIFTPFFTTKRDGSGIGLAVSKQIVRLHGGTLRLSHNSEEKVTFLIVLE